MPSSAQPRTQLLSQLRTSFVQQPGQPLSFLKDRMATPASTTPTVPPALNQTFFSTQEQLDTLEKVMAETVAAKATQPPVPTAPPLPAQLAPIVPQAIQLAQAGGTARPAKEVLSTQPQPPVEAPTAAAATETATTANPVEAAATVQYQEVGPVSPEISPEIESYLQEVTSHQEQLPQEIVIGASDIQMQPQASPLRPVIVLPITPQVEVEGAKKKPSWSVRWLVEWSRRLMKMFAGKVIYREEPDTH